MSPSHPRTPGPRTSYDTEIAVIGAGAAGLSLAHRLCEPARGRRGLEVTLVDVPPGPLRPPERTWCFWEEPGGAYDDVLTASWDRLRLRGRTGEEVHCPLAPSRYKMLRSPDFERMVYERLDAAPRVRRVEATVDGIADMGPGAVVRGRDPAGAPLRLRARWVFDSRPPRALPPARTLLLQHFRGWFVRTAHACFDPAVADLMDFRTPQPSHGLSFGYVLPLGTREALVEYTEFSARPLDDDGYDRALRYYTSRVLGLGAFDVTGVEQGVIPMTDARFPRRTGSSVFRIGTAGGATRPSTGYTFAAVQRQSAAVAHALARGRLPQPPPAYPARARAMDGVLLRALATGRVDGGRFFTRLFRDVGPERMLRFLDGRTSWSEDFAIGLRTPVLPMLRTAAELPWLPRRAGTRS
ncbi:lycopene cyclase [Streptomyces spiroverticillatus]|uniref:Lycopene cyclase n=1 Tax=Streptomyces finlayi TaxID=67296 RepID=A0A918X8E9_9ACTN|nr:lycopene cyclase family protein [Streptomyces finlayi]GHA44798.1 lycopene cyclase [Streptomyces spiroverticillatus]GHD18003.1 lycopene cyclase [Streptomyces finlayi]